jgi:hypothetical protein
MVLRSSRAEGRLQPCMVQPFMCIIHRWQVVCQVLMPRGWRGWRCRLAPRKPDLPSAEQPVAPAISMRYALKVTNMAVLRLLRVPCTCLHVLV